MNEYPNKKNYIAKNNELIEAKNSAYGIFGRLLLVKIYLNKCFRNTK
jgi:hypothetical protein